MIVTVDKNQDGKISYSEFRVRQDQRGKIGEKCDVKAAGVCR